MVLCKHASIKILSNNKELQKYSRKYTRKSHLVLLFQVTLHILALSLHAIMYRFIEHIKVANCLGSVSKGLKAQRVHLNLEGQLKTLLANQFMRKNLGITFATMMLF